MKNRCLSSGFIQSIFLSILLVLPCYVDAAIKLSFEFENGSTLTSDRSGVWFLANAASSPMQISKAATIDFPSKKERKESAESSVGFIHHANNTRFVEVDTEDGIYLVSQDGKSTKLPLDLSFYNSQGAGFIGKVSDFSFEGREFVYLSLKYDLENSTDSIGGETFLVREDGLTVKIANYYFEEEITVEDDGILFIPDCDREIDLSAVEAESRFRPKENGTIFDNDGSKIETEDIVSNVDQTFGNLMDDVVDDPMTAFNAIDSDEIIRNIRIGLAKTELGNIALLGDAGTGKTQLIRSFVYAIAHGKYPEIPRTVRILKLTSSNLSQGTQFTGQFESRVSLLLAACKMVPCILFMDEIQSLRGAGTHMSDSNDIFDRIKTYLADGTLRIIATSTEDEFFHAFGGNRALTDRFKLVKKNEPDRENTIKIAESWLKNFNREMPVESEFLKTAWTLSQNFDPVGSQPRKITNLISETYAALDVDGKFSVAPTIEDLRNAAVRLYNINPALFDKRLMTEKIKKIGPVVESKLIGLDWVKKVGYELFEQRFANAQDPSKPAVRLLLFGPPGVGKTEFAKTIGEGLDLPVVRIEMNNYADGYVEGFRYELAQAIRKNPYSVIVLDEIEKADLAVQTALLALLDSGMMTVSEHLNSGGQGSSKITLNFRNAHIIATTNAGQALVKKGKNGKSIGYLQTDLQTNSPNRVDALTIRHTLIADGISEPVLDRFQALVGAQPATREQFRDIVSLHLERAISEQSKRQETTVVVENKNEFLDYIVEKYFYGGMSNRPAEDLTQMFLRSAVKDNLLRPRASRESVFAVAAHVKQTSEPEKIVIRFDRDIFEQKSSRELKDSSCAQTLTN